MPQNVTIPNSQVHKMTASGSGYDYRIMVKLPDTYEQSEDRYPVVYFVDGNWYFPMVSGVVLPMTAFRRVREIRDAILVGIGYDTDSIPEQFALRARDYTFKQNDALIDTIHESFDFPVIEPTSGKAAEFLDFIRDDLMPFIDKTYRTDPEERIGHGHSFGGLFMLYALFSKPDTFHKIIAASPSVWWDDNAILKHEADYAEAHDDLPVELYIVAGEDELLILSDAAKLVMQLQMRQYTSLKLHYEFMENESHLSIVPRTFVNGLRKLLPIE